MTIETALHLLIVLAIAFGGLLGLWAVLSRWHWAVRTIVPLALIAPLLWRPIYLPFLTLLAEVVTVVLSVAVYRWRWPRVRFSTSGLLLLTVPIAIVVAGLARQPEVDVGLADILRALGFGMLGGLISFAALWLVAGRARWWVRVLAGVGLVLLLAPAWWQLDYLSTGEPFTPDMSLGGWGTAPPPWYESAAMYMPIVTGVLIIFLLVAALARPVVRDRLGWQASVPNTVLPRWRFALLAALAILITAPLAFVTYDLSFPLAVPNPLRAASPAYVDLLALTDDNAFAKVQQLAIPDPIQWDKMAAEVDAAADAYQRLHELLAQPLVPSEQYDSLALNDIQQRREVARLLAYQWEVAERRGDTAAMIAACNAMLDFVEQTDGHGVLIDALVHAAIEGIAQGCLHGTTPAIADSNRLRKLRTRLATYNANRWSYQDLLHRERILCENYLGWQGHLYLLLEDWTGERIYEPAELHRIDRLRPLALATLVIAEMALREYYLEQGSYPGELAELVPRYLSEVPADPLSSTGDSLGYQQTGSTYLLYSRGMDGDDDGGVPPTDEDWTLNVWHADGDLTLDGYFDDDD